MGIIPTMTAMTVEKQAAIRTWCDRQLEINSPAACLRARYQQIKIVTTINKHPNQQEYQTVKRLKTDYSILYLQSHRETGGESRLVYGEVSFTTLACHNDRETGRCDRTLRTVKLKFV
jgi:hypothetical protein